MNDIPPDSLALTGEQKNDVRRMAALGYAPEDIAAYLGPADSLPRSWTDSIMR